MLDQLIGIMRELDADSSVRVLLLRGAGGKAFASGIDLTEMGELSPELLQESDARYNAARLAVRAFSRPSIAAIAGPCIGGGLAIALETDFRICDSSATFGIPATRLGIVYADVAPLIQTSGRGWASEILFTGRFLDAADAERARLVNRIVDPHDLDKSALDLATSIATAAPLSVAATKTLLGAETSGQPVDHSVVRQLVDRCYGSADLREGLDAFAERRPPVFRGL